jgi:predicted phage baseplate assembly protein
VANAVLARHLRAVRLQAAELARQVGDWLRLPGQTLALPEYLPAPVEPTIALDITERDGTTHRWRPVADLVRSGPGDRHFTVDRARRLLVFGDGVAGRIPVPASPDAITLDYLGGAGTDGNVGYGLRWIAAGGGAAEAENPVAARGGAETETAEEARARTAEELGKVERAVSAADFETLARGTPGVAVARAHAAVGYHPGFPCLTLPGAVTLFVVPAVPHGEEIAVDDDAQLGAPVPDPGMLRAVARRLDRRRLLTTEVFVLPARYRPVRVAATVTAPTELHAELRQRLHLRLSTFLDPLIGGEDGIGQPFGASASPSQLRREAEAALGDDGEIRAFAIGIDGGPADETCDRIPIGPHELLVLDRLDLTLRVGAPAGGGLL